MADKSELYQDYLKDESGLVGEAQGFSFPGSLEELVGIVKEAAARGEAIMPQGARTGLCAGAVPRGHRVVSLTRMTGVLGLRYDPEAREALVTVEPGLTLEEFRKQAAAKRFDTAGWHGESLAHLERWRADKTPHFFPPNPTEGAATIGGVIACNASGSHLYGYGSARDYLAGVEAVLADGSILRAGRDALADAFAYTGQREGEAFSLPKSPVPPVSAGTGGYALGAADNLARLLCGSEGTLGVLGALTLRLVPRPDREWGMLLYFDDAVEACAFMERMEQARAGWSGARITVMEYIGGEAMELVEELKPTVSGFRGIPALGKFGAALFLEIAGPGEEAVMEGFEAALLLLEEHSAHAGAALAATEAGELEKLRGLRHAVTEGANILDNRERPGRPRLLLDLILPRADYGPLAERVRREAAERGLRPVLFGHGGCGHLHIRLLADSGAEETARALLEGWTQAFAGAGYACGGEFGLGRIKAPLFQKLHPERAAEMARLRALLDPEARMGWRPGEVVCVS